MRVGIDLVEVEAVRRVLGVHGRRYLARVHTEGELEDWGTAPARLAAAFAAKEAAFKLLGRDDAPLPWRTVALRRSAAGSPELQLTGAAAARAGELGIGRMSVSLARTSGSVCAVVVSHGASA